MTETDLSTPLFTVANEAYQGEDIIEPVIKLIAKAQKLWKKDERLAAKALEEMAEYMEKVFNFKHLSIHVNKTTWWFGSTTSVGRFTIGKLDTKYFDNDDFEQAQKTYRFKKPLANCNLSVYAPNFLDGERLNPREAAALIIREIGYSFFAWGTGRKAEEGIRNAINMVATFGDSDSFLEKIMVSSAVALDYAPSLKVRGTQGHKSGIIGALHTAWSAVSVGITALAMPFVGIISLIVLPFKLLDAIIDKCFGINFDEVDKFADAFAASYGLGPDLASALQKERNMMAIGKDGSGKVMRLYADFTCASLLGYTYASGKCGATNTGAAISRIDSLVLYYEDLLKEQKNPATKKEIQGKLKAMKIQRDYLSKLPSENWSPSIMLTKLWTSLFGSTTEGIDRLDREISNSKRTKKFSLK